MWAKRNTCCLLMVQVPGWCEWLGLHRESRSLAVQASQSSPWRARVLKYLVSSYLPSILFISALWKKKKKKKGSLCKREKKQDGLFQLTGHVTVISFNSTPSVNGMSVTHCSGPHRHFYEDGGRWAAILLVFSENPYSCL